MENQYKTPESNLNEESENNSGMGQDIFPEGVKGWSWGAFLLNWIWACFNKTWIGLIALLPYIGFVMAIILGIKGREWAWKNKRWESVAHFNEVQRKWSIWGAIVVLGIFGLSILMAILIPMMANQ